MMEGIPRAVDPFYESPPKIGISHSLSSIPCVGGNGVNVKCLCLTIMKSQGILPIAAFVVCFLVRYFLIALSF